jgi:hypothetical protein
MKVFKQKIESDDSDKEYEFLCYDNTEPINIDDYYLYFFAGIADVGRCCSENEKEEINPNNRVHNNVIIDLVTGFWKNCYKIKWTNYNVNSLAL